MAPPPRKRPKLHHHSGIHLEMNHEGTVAGEALKRDEVVRLMIQALRYYGYGQSAAQLESESKILLESAPVVAFRDAVLQGRWVEVEALLSKLQIGLLEEHKLKNVKYLIRRQKFLELLEEGKVKEALICIRTEITPMQDDSLKLSKLTSLMMCTDIEELRSRAQWDGAAGNSRMVLLQELRKFIPPSLMIPERRLERLLLQAVEFQRSSCIYHNLKDETVNLFEDHSCDRSQIPRETKVVLSKHTDEIWHLQFSHNGLYLASASKDTTAIIWDLETFSPLHTLIGHGQPLAYIAWSPDDTNLLTCSNDHTVRLWDTKTGECIRVFSKHTECVAACAWLPDGKHFISGGQDKTLLMMDINGNEVKRWTSTRIQDLAVTNDGKTLIVISQEKNIRLFSIDGDSDESETIPEVDNITSLSLSADSRYITVNLSSQEIHLWDLKKRVLVQHYRGHKQGRFVIRSCFGGANQAFVASGSEDHNVYLWHKLHGTLLEVLEGHLSTVNATTWSPTDPCLLASASDDHTIRLWGPASSSTSAPSSPNGAMEVTFSNGGSC